MEASNIVKNGLLVTEVLRCLWEGAGDNHRSLMDWVRFPETKLAFPIDSNPHHVTGLRFWLERSREKTQPLTHHSVAYFMQDEAKLLSTQTYSQSNFEILS